MRAALISTLFILLFTGVCIAQQSGGTNKNSNIGKTEFNDTVKELRLTLKELNNKLDSISVVNKKLVFAQDTIAKYIDDTRLRRSIASAESTINMQNSWLTGFGTLYTYITIIVAIIAVVISFVQITSIRSAVEDARIANRDARNSVDSLRDRIQEFDKRIEEKFDLRFEEYSKKLKTNQINQIINDMTVPNTFLRDQACFRLTSFKRSDMDAIQINRLLTLLRQRLALTVEETIIFFITREEN